MKMPVGLLDPAISPRCLSSPAADVFAEVVLYEHQQIHSRMLIREADLGLEPLAGVVARVHGFFRAARAESQDQHTDQAHQ